VFFVITNCDDVPLNKEATVIKNFKDSEPLAKSAADVICVSLPRPDDMYYDAKKPKRSASLKRLYDVVQNLAQKSLLPQKDVLNACFHQDTCIVHADSQLRLADLRQHAAFAVPHIITTDGLAIHTDSGAVLRVTPNHMIFSQRGVHRADELCVGDTLFTSLDEKQRCRVVKIAVEHQQTYFGLNAETTEILADGIKVSVFGNHHVAPSLWFRLMSPVIGVAAASTIMQAAIDGWSRVSNSASKKSKTLNEVMLSLL
jgi:hypothetical protein